MGLSHSRSGEAVNNWVGNQLAAGCDTRLEWGYFQLPTQKAKNRWATSTKRGGLTIGHVFGSPSKAIGRLCITDVKFGM